MPIFFLFVFRYVAIEESEYTSAKPGPPAFRMESFDDMNITSPIAIGVGVFTGQLFFFIFAGTDFKGITSYFSFLDML